MENIRKKTAALLLAASLLFLSACGGQDGPNAEDSQSPSDSPPASSQPADGPAPSASEPSASDPSAPAAPADPLTGLPMDEEAAQSRPVAIMLNNLKDALPQQGNGGADIIYELIAEGGITRMLGVYQTLEGVDIIGSVRSARPYYIELALGHDAIFVHAGGSEDAYAALDSWKVDHMDGVRGTYSMSGLFWRARERVAGKYFGLEHSLVTSGEAIRSALAGSGFRLQHESGYVYDMSFASDGTPADGEDAGTVTVPFSGYKTGVFRYDEGKRLYLVEEYGQAYIDGNSGDQIAVTNVLVLRAQMVSTGDSYGHMEADLSGGDGWFACGGKLIPITWTKAGRDSQISYYRQDGSPLALGQGKSYVNIVPKSVEISWS